MAVRNSLHQLFRQLDISDVGRDVGRPNRQVRDPFGERVERRRYVVPGLFRLVSAHALVGHREQPQHRDVRSEIGVFIEVDIFKPIEVALQSARVDECIGVTHSAEKMQHALGFGLAAVGIDERDVVAIVVSDVEAVL